MSYRKSCQHAQWKTKTVQDLFPTALVLQCMCAPWIIKCILYEHYPIPIEESKCLRLVQRPLIVLNHKSEWRTSHYENYATLQIYLLQSNSQYLLGNRTKNKTYQQSNRDSWTNRTKSIALNVLQISLQLCWLVATQTSLLCRSVASDRMRILVETKASTARTFTADNHVQCLEIHRIALLCPLIHSYSCLNLRIMQSQQGTRVQ